MLDLNFITRKYIKTLGEPKPMVPLDKRNVYLEWDTAAAFYIIRDILHIYDCVIWYRDIDSDKIYDFPPKRDMELFIIPITKHLLTKYMTIFQREYTYAREHQIPVLLLMIDQDEEVKELLYKECGDVPYLRHYRSKHVINMYDTLLYKYLAMVLEPKRDYGKEFSQIKDAAYQGSLEDIDTLIDMYTLGIGVPFSYEEAFILRQKKIHLLQKAYENQPSEEHLLEFVDELCSCGDFCQEIEREEEAILYYLNCEKWLMEFSKEMESQKLRDKYATICYRLSLLYKDNNSDKEMEYYNKAFQYKGVDELAKDLGVFSFIHKCLDCELEQYGVSREELIETLTDPEEEMNWILKMCIFE